VIYRKKFYCNSLRYLKKKFAELQEKIDFAYVQRNLSFTQIKYQTKSLKYRDWHFAKKKVSLEQI